MQVVLDLDLAPGPGTRRNAHLSGTRASRQNLTEGFTTSQNINVLWLRPISSPWSA